MIDLAAVDALIAISRTGTVHGAAADLGFTPSAVSQQIKRLERDLGARLLDREGRGVVLTAAGRRVVDEGGMLRERVEELRSRLHDAGALPVGCRRGRCCRAMCATTPGHARPMARFVTSASATCFEATRVRHASTTGA